MKAIQNWSWKIPVKLLYLFLQQIIYVLQPIDTVQPQKSSDLYIATGK